MNPIRVLAFKREITRAREAGIPEPDLQALLQHVRETRGDPYDLASAVDGLLERGINYLPTEAT